MSSSETSAILDTMTVGMRATTKLTKDFDKSDEKLTPEILAAAIKLASLSTDHQEKLTPNTVNAAIKLAKYPLNQKVEQGNLTPESLAIALKFSTRISQSTTPDNIATDQISIDQMRIAIDMTQEGQSDESVISDILADAIKLANE
jgi:hypothetical protein